MRVLNRWRQVYPQGTLADLLRAFEAIENNTAVDTLAEKWYVKVIIVSEHSQT